MKDEWSDDHKGFKELAYLYSKLTPSEEKTTENGKISLPKHLTV